MRSSISPEPALLGFLLERPLHGYDIHKQVLQHFGIIWRLEMSQMYAILKTYADRGWIEMHLQSQTARPSKKVLKLTALGKRAFEEWMQKQARGMREFRVDFFLRLYFARAAGAAEAKKLIARQMASIKHEQQAMMARDDLAQDDFFQLTRDFRVHQLGTILKWLEDNRDKLVHSKFAVPPTTEKARHRPALLRHAVK